MNKNVSSKEQKLQHIIELEQKLNDIQDMDILLERILTEARKIENADAGSIYVVSGKKLQIKYAQNDTQLHDLPPGDKLPYAVFSFPIDGKSVAGYVAFTGRKLNIADVYNIPSTFSFRFNKQTDILTGYRTKSIYTMPLKMANGTLLGILQIINAQDANGNIIPFDADAELYLDHFATHASQVLQQAFSASVMNRRILRLAEFRDPKETYPHVERVAKFSVEIYDRWAFDHNIPEDERHRFRDNLSIAAKFHDIGKIGISDTILKKTARFTDEERAIMQGHTCLGGMLYASPENPLAEMERDVALHHHEWYDGSERGYPGNFDEAFACTKVDSRPLSDEDRTNPEVCTPYELSGPVTVRSPLKGDEIPLAARIVAVADVFDALTHSRCYKDAWSVDDAFCEIQQLAGIQFDPDIVLSFLKIRERICSILSAIPDSPIARADCK